MCGRVKAKVSWSLGREVSTIDRQPCLTPEPFSRMSVDERRERSLHSISATPSPASASCSLHWPSRGSNTESCPMLRLSMPPVELNNIWAWPNTRGFLECPPTSKHASHNLAELSVLCRNDSDARGGGGIAQHFLIITTKTLPVKFVLWLTRDQCVVTTLSQTRQQHRRGL